ncbi:MAG: hypothetical protein M3P32_05385, partial [Chloroflexota bacterium]|nr:hypothetical protein [Chloroflexota bacterium]
AVLMTPEGRSTSAAPAPAPAGASGPTPAPAKGGASGAPGGGAGSIFSKDREAPPAERATTSTGTAGNS